MLNRNIRKLWDKSFYYLFLKFNNLASNEKVVGDSIACVSLTSHGKRVDTVFYTIESIGRGRVKPRRLILWIDDESLMKNLPASVRRLQARGLEVLPSKNYGPHTKYYPYVKNCFCPNLALVTADDDNFYPNYWLEGLISAYMCDAGVVNCYRAHATTLNDREDGIARFGYWTMCHSTTPSFSHHATGVGGVIYPPILQKALQDAGDAFMEMCPKADDIWLHVTAIRNGFKIKQINESAIEFTAIPFSQGDGLKWKNAYAGDNDIQAEATYLSSDIEIIKSHF